MTNHGGKRDGAGRPKGSNRYGEPTRPVRIPESQVERVLRFVGEREYALPLYASGVSAGFPSPADDYLEGVLDLNSHLVREPAATFFVRARGDSMIEAGILDGDLVIIKRGDTANTGDIVVALVHDEEATLKKLRKKGGSIALEAANPAYETRIFGPNEVKVQGRLVGLIRRYH